MAILQERRRSVAVIKERSGLLEHAMSILQQGIHASMQKVCGEHPNMTIRHGVNDAVGGA